MKRYIIGTLCILIIIVFACSNFPIVGVTKSKLESEALKYQEVDEHWNVSKSVSNKISAFIFYNEDLSDYTYSVYVNKDGFSFGYFFSHGGKTIDVLEGIAGFSSKEGMALVSMNTINAVKVERIFDNDEMNTEIYDLDPDKPFAITFPSNDIDGGAITIYDKNGNSIPIDNIMVSD